jgi:phosphoglycolate phosphatase-like HAD superfamily hydrolase
MPPVRPLLLLFDIDGTLLLSGRAGVRGLNLAIDRLYGRRDALDGVAMAGRTDRAIVIEVLRGIGREPDEAEIRQVRDAYCECLTAEIGRPVDHPSGVLPGVGALLDALDARRDLAVGLLTGNFERGAAIKLGHFDLGRRFAFGAFGDEHVDRRALVPVAIARARAHLGGADLVADRVVVIGDTPLDVDCAKAHQAWAVGVATGGFSRAALEAAGADLVLDTLADRDRFLAWVKKTSEVFLRKT